MEVRKYGIYVKLDEILEKLCKIEEYYRSISKVKNEEEKVKIDVEYDEYLFGYKGGDKK